MKTHGGIEQYWDASSSNVFEAPFETGMKLDHNLVV